VGPQATLEKRSPTLPTGGGWEVLLTGPLRSSTRSSRNGWKIIFRPILNIDNHLFVNVSVSNDAAKLFKVDFSVFILKKKKKSSKPDFTGR
jgi:hypothetical protein